MSNTNNEIITPNENASSNRATSSDWWILICKFAPFAIIIKLYSLVIMFWDMAYLIFFTVITIFRSIVQVLRPLPMKPVDNEIAMIVGASRGVGREIALQLSDLGAIVICVDINKTANIELVKTIQSNGGTAYGYTCDVTKKEDIEKVTKLIETNVGAVTMLYHCCGVPSPRSLIEGSPSIQNTMDVSIVSHFLLLDAILPKMKKQEHGHVVFLTSVAGLSGIKHQMPLSVSQFAVQGIFESLVEELRIARFHEKINISIVHIYPFIISDDLENDIRLRIPSYFGRIRAQVAAKKIIDGVRRNYMEISIPSYLLYLGHIVRLLPRRATFMLRELLDTGVDFG